MGTDNIIVREYLESLREDDELDKIFPLLLSIKGFKIIRTAKEAKGQPQYGKDIIAVGKDQDGIRKRFYFELKGHDDKDIDIKIISKSDGIRESLHEMKYGEYFDASVFEFNSLPKKYILVHNGTIKPNAVPVLNGIVNELFAEGEFERWDIYELTAQFSTFLFGEYLLTDKENIRLLKTTLVLLDSPNYDFKEFKDLVARLLSVEIKVNSRAFQKLFATLNLLSFIIFHYSKECNNLEPAKIGMSEIVLKTWWWILKNKLQTSKAAVKQFDKLLYTQYLVLKSYFEKTLDIASHNHGLFFEKGGAYEDYAYSMRCFDYISYLVYFFSIERHFLKSTEKQNDESLQKRQILTIRKIIDANSGSTRPLLDRHSRPILLVFMFVFNSEFRSVDDEVWLNNYICSCFDSLLLIHRSRGHLPEFNDNDDLLVEYMSTSKRPDGYEDSSSMLIMILLELLAILRNSGMYKSVLDIQAFNVNLQTAYPVKQSEGGLFEENYFYRNINDLMAVESSLNIPNDFSDFITFILTRPRIDIVFRTDEVGLGFLRVLSVIYYHNDIFPLQWRELLLPD